MLVRELQSLCLDVELIDKNAKPADETSDGAGKPVVALGGITE